ncbi:hypothetical protein Ancab_019633 [Ancistrocladus abbreviatus]
MGASSMSGELEELSISSTRDSQIENMNKVIEANRREENVEQKSRNAKEVWDMLVDLGGVSEVEESVIEWKNMEMEERDKEAMGKLEDMRSREEVGVMGSFLRLELLSNGCG